MPNEKYFTTRDDREPEEAGQEYRGKLTFHSDGKHIIVRLGCREYVCHTLAEVMKRIEKEVAEIFENRKRTSFSLRAQARRERLIKSMEKTKKKVKTPKRPLPKELGEKPIIT